jgi:hypothetical protein
MIISDGTTSLTFSGTQVDDFIELQQSVVMSAGGQLKSQNVANRFIVNENIRVTGLQLSALMTLLSNESDYYYYTPTVTPDYMSAGDFPMKVIINVPKKTAHARNGNDKIYYVSLTIQGYDYI